MEGTDADHHRIHGAGLPAGNTLKGIHYLCPHINGIHRVLGHGAVSAFPDNLNIHEGSRCIAGTGIHGDGAALQVREYVHARHRIQLPHLSGLQHLYRAVGQFLCRLEDKFYRAFKLILMFCQNPGRCQKHADMCVMSAGVHDALVLGTVGKILNLPDGKRVDIAAQANHRLVLFSFQGGNSAGSRHLLIRNPHPGKFIPDPSCCLHLLPAQLRMLMEFPPHTDGIIMIFPNFFYYVHSQNPFLLNFFLQDCPFLYTFLYPLLYTLLYALLYALFIPFYFTCFTGTPVKTDHNQSERPRTERLTAESGKVHVKAG